MATRQSDLSSIIKRSRDIMRKDAGLNGDTDRIPQFAWLLFLKAFDDFEETREATFADYTPALKSPFRWRDWAADATTRRSGDPLLEFVNTELLPHLADLPASGQAGDTKQSLRDIFAETRNRMLSGYLLADLIDQVNRISFTSADDIHTMAHMYESMLREMRDAAGDAGEFYTPRPVIRFIVGRIDPKPGETIMDPAAGTGGFLVEAWEHIVAKARTARQRDKIRGTLRGFEKKPMPFLLGQMNMMLHGVVEPKVVRGNALRFTLAEQKNDGVDIVITNPPFGGEEEAAVRGYFPKDLQTSETSWLFLQSVMERIRKSKTGRAAVIVPNSVLFETGTGAKIRAKLLREFNLHTIVRLPNGVFAPYTLIPSNILFFDNKGPTKEISFYELSPPDGRKNYTKTKPMRYEEFSECETWWDAPLSKRAQSPQMWKVDPAALADEYILDLHSQNLAGDLDHRPVAELLDEMISTQQEILKIMNSLRAGVS